MRSCWKPIERAAYARGRRIAAHFKRVYITKYLLKWLSKRVKLFRASSPHAADEEELAAYEIPVGAHAAVCKRLADMLAPVGGSLYKSRRVQRCRKTSSYSRSMR